MQIKTITVTAHDRPDLLSKTLDALSKNNTDGWEIFVSIEPTELTDGMVTIVKDRFPDANILLPETKLGVRENPFQLLKHVFEDAQSDINIYLEEDLDISPDVCDIAEFYLKKGCPEVCVCLCNHNIYSETIIDSEKLLTETEKFSALGMILSRDSWDENFEPNWNAKLRRGGWDDAMQQYVIRNKKTILMPVFSRSTHTGEWGTHCRPKIHQILGYNDIKIYKEGGISGEYRIIISEVPETIELECNDSYPDGVPYVSIVMSTFNKASFLDKTLSSIRNQITKIPYEIIVVDDGSGDDPLSVCKKHGCKYIWIDGGGYRNPAVPRNVGCMAARGKVLILQSDDVVHKSADCIDKLARVQKGEAMFATVYNMKEDGTIGQLYVGEKHQRPLFFLGSIHRDDFWAIGGNDEDFKAPGYEDTWLGECISKKYKITYSEIVGCHQEHIRPKNLKKLVEPSKKLFDKKMEEGVFEARNRPLASKKKLIRFRDEFPDLFNVDEHYFENDRGMDDKRLEYYRAVDSGFKLMRDKSFVICGIARDCENSLREVTIPFVEELIPYIGDYFIHIYENDSKKSSGDDTAGVLREWEKQHEGKSHMVCEELDLSRIGGSRPNRTNILAEHRNKVLNYVHNNLRSFDYMMVLDWDMGAMSLNGIAHSINALNEIDDAAAMTAMGVMEKNNEYIGYWDTLAYRGGRSMRDRWSTVRSQARSHCYRKIGSHLCKIGSGFNGIAIYDMKKLCDAIDQNIDSPLSQRFGNIYGNGADRCAGHVNLHHSLLDCGYSVWLNPSLVTYYQG